MNIHSDDVFTPSVPGYKTQPDARSQAKNTMSKASRYKLTQALSKVAAHSLHVAAEEFKKKIVN